LIHLPRLTIYFVATIVLKEGVGVNHDIVVMGASAGGTTALRTVFSGLPPDLPASVFVTVHTSPTRPSYLAETLARVCPLPVAYANYIEDIQRGKAYVARSDRHLIIKRGHIECRFVAKEHETRPAIDPMFRSAAHSYSRRVIGVLLTGALDDGVAGLGVIKDEGGIVVVQDPKNARFNDMPRAALRAVLADHVVPLADMARLLVDLVNTEVEGEAAMEQDEPKEGERVCACPGCGGVLRQFWDNDVMWYQCHVGHRFSPEGAMLEQDDALEEQLWGTVAVLKQKAEMARTMAADALSPRGTHIDPEYYEKQARAAQEAAEMIEKLIQEKGNDLFPGPSSGKDPTAF